MRLRYRVNQILTFGNTDKYSQIISDLILQHYRAWLCLEIAATLHLRCSERQVLSNLVTESLQHKAFDQHPSYHLNTNKRVWASVCMFTMLTSSFITLFQSASTFANTLLIFILHRCLCNNFSRLYSCLLLIHSYLLT